MSPFWDFSEILSSIFLPDQHHFGKFKQNLLYRYFAREIFFSQSLKYGKIDPQRKECDEKHKSQMKVTGVRHQGD
jgi:hypothetical protein